MIHARHCLILCVIASASSAGAAGEVVRFNRDIRPILSDHCFQCHGPDATTREAELRLDDDGAVFGSHDRAQILVAGDPDGSELYRRITSADESERMPPADSGPPLSPGEIKLLKQWIEQGADYERHWSFVTPQRPTPPVIRGDHWSRNPIDQFVLERLKNEGLQPSPQADRRTLIRRVTLDLTGLPPTPVEVAAFVDDESPRAYENVVDRLLASPRYGERMAVEWLDAARYADTHGYLFDTERSMWRWRDWVIGSFNRNQPFDEFTIEQLAGDLLPDPTLDQLIATGFNRNHIINNEAGATPQEYFVENIVDRVNTTATVWTGLTMGCAQCHEHKYDPFTQREYYELYAFFNNVPESGLDGFNSNAKPNIAAPTSGQLQKLADIDRQLAEAEAVFAPVAEALKPAQAEWEQQTSAPLEPVNDGLVVHLPLDGDVTNQANAPGSLEFKDGVPTFEPGLFGSAAAMDGQRYVEMQTSDAIDFGPETPFSLSAWVNLPDQAGRRAIFSKLEPPEASFRGYTLQVVNGLPALFLVNKFPGNSLVAQAKQKLDPGRWHHIVAVYDGSGTVDGAKLYVNGEVQELGLKIDELSDSIRNDKPLWIGNGHPGAKFKGRIDDARIYNRALSDEEIERLPGRSIQTLLAIDEADRSEDVARRIRNHYLENEAPDEWRSPYERLNELRDQQKVAVKSQTTVMVMEELDEPRETRMLVRGAYNAPGERVTPATPAALPPMDEDLPKNRLGFARWLTDPAHPLTARVAVNRYWQMYFGSGLVRTSDNFGLQGEWPSHPELLDWLATQFVESGWDVKALQRLIVTSATYRQSSQVSSDLLETDPLNRLLARGPRHRLPAETIRDSALAVSGLLVEKLGGPSVKPYQPADLWKEVAFDTSGNNLTAQIYQQDEGDSLYRRSMYTYWKRTAPPPTMLIFDGPDRERCVVRRERTNTPLQALVLMNDPTYVEASRKLAERMLSEAGSDPSQRVAWAYELVLSRQPSVAELEPLLSLLDEQRARFSGDSEASQALVNVGASPHDESLDACEIAAYTVIASILLNLDETVTKG